MIRYLSVDFVVALNAELGGPGAGVRDLHVVESAVFRPQSGFGGQDVHATVSTLELPQIAEWLQHYAIGPTAGGDDPRGT